MSLRGKNCTLLMELLREDPIKPVILNFSYLPKKSIRVKRKCSNPYSEMNKRFQSQFNCKVQMTPIPERPHLENQQAVMQDITNKQSHSTAITGDAAPLNHNRSFQYDFIECLENNWVAAPPDEFDNINNSFISDKLLHE